MSKKEFEDIKAGLIANIRKPFDTLFEESSFFVDEISERTFEFDKFQKMEREVDLLTREEVQNTFAKLFVDDCKRIDVHVSAREPYKQYLAELSTLNDPSLLYFKDYKSVKRRLYDLPKF